MLRLSVDFFTLNFIVLGVIMLNFIIMSVVAPLNYPPHPFQIRNFIIGLLITNVNLTSFGLASKFSYLLRLTYIELKAIKPCANLRLYTEPNM
jgi:hypothetical protein